MGVPTSSFAAWISSERRWRRSARFWRPPIAPKFSTATVALNRGACRSRRFLRPSWSRKWRSRSSARHRTGRRSCRLRRQHRRIEELSNEDPVFETPERRRVAKRGLHFSIPQFLNFSIRRPFGGRLLLSRSAHRRRRTPSHGGRTLPLPPGPAPREPAPSLLHRPTGP